MNSSARIRTGFREVEFRLAPKLVRIPGLVAVVRRKFPPGIGAGVE